jgi:hypothetical protein
MGLYGFVYKTRPKLAGVQGSEHRGFAGGERIWYVGGVITTCPHCRSELPVPDHLAGRMITCGNCGRALQAPPPMVAPLVRARRKSKERETIVLAIVAFAFIAIAGGLFLGAQLAKRPAKQEAPAWTAPAVSTGPLEALQMNDAGEWRQLRRFVSDGHGSVVWKSFTTVGDKYRLRYRLERQTVKHNSVTIRGFDADKVRTFEMPNDENTQPVGFLEVYAKPGEQTLEIVSINVRWVVEIDLPVSE